MTAEHDETFEAMGSEIRILVGEGARSARGAARDARHFVNDFDHRLSRFRPESELCRLNADPRTTVPCSSLLRTAVAAGLWAAQRSGGLVDPTLVGEIETAGYAASRSGIAPASLTLALASRPERRPALPHPRAAWREIKVDDASGTVTRPVGLRFDTGGTGKGLAADAVAHMLRGQDRLLVDCGGDLRIAGIHAADDPYEVEVEHPLSGERAHTVRLGAGGIATSGLNLRLWEAEGRFAHHLLDPSTGEPAWTGLIGVTSLGPTALEAETLAKTALLAGPLGARRVLAVHGGLAVHDDGDVELIGPLAGRPQMRVVLPARGAAA